ncbi:MAG: choice-of-anchor D domain-containing protein [Balneolaceae bacterium]|nr:MAG: choice-of-anchor D domain-containing protein [Balneolaceae bacterium]
MLHKKLFTHLLRLNTIFIISVWITLVSGKGIVAQEINMDNLMVKPAPNMEHVCTLDPTDIDAHFYIAPDRELAKNFQAAATSTFEVNYRVDIGNACGDTAWPNEVFEAFEYAMDIWSVHLSSNVPIRIDAVWTELGERTLGSAGPTRVVQLPGVGMPDTWYTISQLSAMANRVIRDEIDGVEHDVRININCNFSDWYFGTDANTPAGRIDFVSVVLHEIGHGIGFIGGISVPTDDDQEVIEETGTIGLGSPLQPLVYDRFAIDGNTNSILNSAVYPNPSNAIFEAVTGRRGGLFFDGEDALFTLAELPIETATLYTPEEYTPGSSYSHVDQETFTNTPNALMRPRIDRAFAVHSPGPLFCGMLSDMGWPLGVGCLSFLAADAQIAVDRNRIEFGVSNVGSTVQQTITISSNNDSAEMLSGGLTVDNDNFSIEGETSFGLQPGTEAQFTIQYVPQTDERHSGNLTIFHNANNIPSPIVIPLSGEALQADQIVRLEQSFPNPSVATAGTSPTIPFVISEDSDVRLDLYSIDGRHIHSLVNSRRAAGRYNEMPDMSNLSSGVYIYRLIVGNKVESKKLMYVR